MVSGADVGGTAVLVAGGMLSLRGCGAVVVTGAGVTGACVTGSCMTGACVTGACVTSACVTGASVTGACVTSACVTGIGVVGAGGAVGASFGGGAWRQNRQPGMNW